MISDILVRNACFSADAVAVGFIGTEADKTRAIVRRALEALEANGMIKVVPESEWPSWYIPDPPYKVPSIPVKLIKRIDAARGKNFRVLIILKL
jgi:hypothetical protein